MVGLSALTEAERTVVAALLEGLRYADIALRRGVTVHTVSKQASSAYRKLGVASRSELVARSARAPADRREPGPGGGDS